MGTSIINCQNVKMFGQANGTLEIFKLLPWLPGLPWKHKRVAKLGHFLDMVALIKNWSL